MLLAKEAQYDTANEFALRYEHWNVRTTNQRMSP